MRSFMRSLLTTGCGRQLMMAMGCSLLCACGNSDLTESVAQSKRGTAPPPNPHTLSELVTHSIIIDVPAGEWRMVRLRPDFFPFDGEATVIQASFPGPGAEPWAGHARQLIRHDTQQLALNVNLYIRGLLQDVPSFTGLTLSLTNADTEAAFIFGSRGGATRFYLGALPPPPPGITVTVADPMEFLGTGETREEFYARFAALAQEIADRPHLPASMESGIGGFGATYVRAQLSSGETIEYRTGPISAEVTTGSELPSGVKLDQIITTHVEQTMPEAGTFFYGIGALRKAGVCEWSVLAEMPQFRRDYGSTYACIGEYGVRTYVPTDDKGGGVTYGFPGALFASSPTPPGDYRLEFRHTLNGRDGGDVAGRGDLAGRYVSSHTLVFAGYINADFNKLYGWNAGLTEQHY